ncbi:AAA family ATPase [Vagococcus fessus]|nr:AAA family ATPase [Vagococcus fessus]
MKIVALIDKENKVFNFDKEYTVVHENSETTILKNVDKPLQDKTFYGVDSITCVAGKNGVGKTNLLKSIVDDKTTSFGLKIFKDNSGNIFFQKGTIKKGWITTDRSFSVKMMTSKNLEKHVPDKSIYYFYSNTLETGSVDLSSDSDIKTVKDISTSHFLNTKGYQQFVREEMLAQVKMLAERYEQIQPTLDISDKKLVMGLSQFGEGVNGTAKFLTTEKVSISNFKVDDFFEKQLKIKEKSPLDLFQNNNKVKGSMPKTLMSMYFSLFYSQLKDDLKKQLLEELSNFKKEKDNKDKKEVEPIDFNSIYTKYFQNIFSKEELERLNEALSYFLDMCCRENFSFPKTVGEDGDKADIPLFLTFIKYDESSDWFIRELASLFTFSWKGLSSGEFSLLSLFGRIHKASIEAVEENITLLLDEVDIGLHPTWQLKWLDTFLKVMTETNKEKNIQIIFTTHSPLMVSDMLESNTILVESKNKIKEDKEQTFGTNIYNLYRDGFFLEGNNFGVLGDFSARKIQNVIDELNRIEEYKNDNHIADLEDCKKVIDVIGDPIIKNSLEKKYEKIYNKLTKNTDEREIVLEKWVALFEKQDPDFQGDFRKRINANIRKGD